MDKFTRQLTLVALLEQHAWPLSFEDIRERLPEAYPQAEPESARRAFERDKSDILAMGVPLLTQDVPDDPSNSAYTITRKRSTVGDPGFTPAELAALRFAATAMALRQEGADEPADATDGLRKYGGLGGSEQAPTIAELRLDANLTALFTAIIRRLRVGFTYGGRTRQVLPDRLANIDGRWYVRCEDLDAAATRTFRLDRIDGAVLPAGDDPGPTEHGTAPTPGDTDPTAGGQRQEPVAAAVRFRPWEFGDGDPVRVSVALDSPAAAVALAEHPELEVEGHDGDRTVLRISVRSREGLWPWLAGFLDRAEVLGPPDVRADYIAHLVRLLEAEEKAEA